MSILDEWFTGFQAAATSVATALAGAGAAWLALRRRVSADTAEIKETSFKIGWLERLVKEREEQDARIESLRESQLNDARVIARQEAVIAAGRERINEANVDRDRVQEELRHATSRMAACEEKAILLRDEVLELKLANGRLFKELASIDKDAAERLLVLHLKPAPTAKPEDQT